MPMAVKLSLLSGPVVVFDTVQNSVALTLAFFYKNNLDKSFKQYKDSHSIGFPFIDNFRL